MLEDVVVWSYTGMVYSFINSLVPQDDQHLGFQGRYGHQNRDHSARLDSGSIARPGTSSDGR